MKPFGLLFLLAVSSPAAMFAVDEPVDPATQWHLAVSQYIQGATTELDVYRQQIASTAHSQNQSELKEAKAKLADCDQLVTKLKSADATNFDLLKGDYERTRAELVKALQAALKS